MPAHHRVALPDDVSYDTAYGTAWRMMMTIGKIKAGEKVLIFGASGGVGTCCVQLAKLASADHLLNYKQDDFMKCVFTHVGKSHRRLYEAGMDVAMNFTGDDTWVKSLHTLHRGRRLLTCGATAGYDPKEDLRFVWSYELQILGSNGWARDEPVQFAGTGARRQTDPPSLITPMPLPMSMKRFVSWKIVWYLARWW